MVHKRYKTLRLKRAAESQPLTKCFTKKNTFYAIQDSDSMLKQLPKELFWMIIDHAPGAVLELRQVKRQIARKLKFIILRLVGRSSFMSISMLY